MVTSSLPLLAALITAKELTGGGFHLIGKVEISRVITLVFLLAFFVKLPLFFTHIWLLKAHVEAPVQGSIVLAALLLKTGSYGIARLISILYFSPFFKSLVIVWRLGGAFLISISCLFQRDVKQLIALSSVAHIGLISGCLLRETLRGFWGGLVIIVGHGFSSSGLFFSANCAYLQVKRRNIKVLKRVGCLGVGFMVPWFLLAVSNIAAPPTLNTLGEIYAIRSLMAFSFDSVLFLAPLVFLAAAYSLTLFNRVIHKKKVSIFPGEGGGVREHLTLFLHWLPVFVCVTKVADV